MAEIYRKLDITFSKNEIKSLLAERAREMALKRKGIKHVELSAVAHVEGNATVTLTIGDVEINEDIKPWP